MLLVLLVCRSNQRVQPCVTPKRSSDSRRARETRIAGRLVCKGELWHPARVGGNLPSTRPTVLPASPPHPPGNLYKCESKGFAAKAICKTMKTKGAQNTM